MLLSDDLVSSCLEGFNATVFAYGQTVSVNLLFILLSVHYKEGISTISYSKGCIKLPIAK